MKKAIIITLSVLLSVVLLAVGLIWLGNVMIDNYKYDAPETVTIDSNEYGRYSTFHLS